MISIYSSTATDFSKNGLVVLTDFVSISITENLNGMYELEGEILLDSRSKWTYVVEDNIIKADGQLFRIYNKIKTLKSIKFNARHIFYDLLDNYVDSITLTSTSGSSALSYVIGHTQYSNSFTASSDVGGSSDFSISEDNPVNLILGSGGIIDNYGGEIKRDNFSIQLLNARGLDRGVLVSYGKNILGIEETLDRDTLITRLKVVGKDNLSVYVDSPYINNYPHPKIKRIDYSDLDTTAKLTTAGQNYFTSTGCDIPQFNYVVDFIELTKTEQYKNYAILETVYLGDTVTIKHTRLNINLKAKVIKITKNPITGRIEKVELGSFKKNLAISINNSNQEIKQNIVQVTSDYQKAIDNATSLITGSNGGNVVIKQYADGTPYEIDIMDTTNVNTATKVWRWNSSGFGYSSTGYNGPFTTAITQDGQIVGSFIQALSISGSQIKANTITANKLASDVGSSLDLSSNTSIKLAVGQIGGNNLVKNSRGYFGTTFWLASSSPSFGNVDGSQSWNQFKRNMLMFSNTTTSENFMQQFGIAVKPNTKYTFSFSMYIDPNVGSSDAYVIGSTNNDGAYSYVHGIAINISPRTPTYYKGTFTTASDENYVFIRFDNNGYINSNTGYNYVMVTDVKLEEGENATAWSPNSNEINAVNVLIDGTGLTVKNGAMQVVNNDNRTVFKVDTNGYLYNEWGITVVGKTGDNINAGSGPVVGTDQETCMYRNYGLYFQSLAGRSLYLMTNTGVKIMDLNAGAYKDLSCQTVNANGDIWSNGYVSGASIINRSERELKTDISEFDYSIAYEGLKNLNLYHYKMKSEIGTVNEAFYLGTMVDEAPQDIVQTGGGIEVANKYINIYSFISYVAAAEKVSIDKITALENELLDVKTRLTALENKIVTN